MRSWLIHLLDMVDNHVLRHRFGSVCYFVANSDWWPEGECPCRYCAGFRSVT